MDERLVDQPMRYLVHRMATSDPVPGGGSAAAMAGAMGAALIHMVVELSVGRPDTENFAVPLTEIGVASAQFQSELMGLVDADAVAYAAVVHSRRLPRTTEREREARRVQFDAAIREAVRAPLAVARAASEVLDLAARLAPIGNRKAISDVGVGAMLASTALRGAALNVEINLPMVKGDETLRDDAAAEIRTLLDSVGEREAAVRSTVADRMP
ncbi:MAG: cyclodeaminase/cyclohydrolase family protein [Candidatus Limnocylindria bacterium]